MRTEPEGSTSPIYSDSNISPDVQKWFEAVDKDHSGKITEKELQAALINAQGKTFSDEACRLMIALFNKNKNATVDIYEFQHLYTYVNQWIDVFKAYDANNSGYIEEMELEEALHQMGYRLSNNFVKVLLENSTSSMDNVKRISFDQFIVACVKMQRLTNAFRLRDKDMKGIVSLGFDEFVAIVLEDFL